MNDDMETPATGPETPSLPSAEGAAVALKTSRSPLLHVSTIVGILALLGAGVFAFKNVAGSKSGASTPEAAVQSLLDAVSGEDLIGVLQQLDPGERDALRDPIERMRNELVRLGALDKNASLSGFPGIDITFKDVKLASTSLGADVSVVRFTGGTVTTTVDPARLPLGSFLRNFTPGDSKRMTSTDTLGTSGDEFVVTVKRGGRWYASLFYSIAESARKAARAPQPDFGNGVPARGGASAEKAVDAFIRAAASFNVENMIAVTPPDEMAALHDYAQLFINEAQAAIQALAGDVRASVTSLDLGSESLYGDAKVVWVKKIGVRVTTSDGVVTANYDGNCLTTTGGGEFLPPRLCGDELRKSPGFFNLDIPRGRTGFVVVERGGAWYVSPTRTVLETIVSSLKAMRPGDLDKIKNGIMGLFGGERTYSQTLPKDLPYPIPSLPLG